MPFLNNDQQNIAKEVTAQIPLGCVCSSHEYTNVLSYLVVDNCHIASGAMNAKDILAAYLTNSSKPSNE